MNESHNSLVRELYVASYAAVAGKSGVNEAAEQREVILKNAIVAAETYGKYAATEAAKWAVRTDRRTGAEASEPIRPQRADDRAMKVRGGRSD